MVASRRETAAGRSWFVPLCAACALLTGVMSCLNPRPEELPSDHGSDEPGREEAGGALGTSPALPQNPSADLPVDGDDAAGDPVPTGPVPPSPSPSPGGAAGADAPDAGVDAGSSDGALSEEPVQ